MRLQARSRLLAMRDVDKEIQQAASSSFSVELSMILVSECTSFPCGAKTNAIKNQLESLALRNPFALLHFCAFGRTSEATSMNPGTKSLTRTLCWWVIDWGPSSVLTLTQVLPRVGGLSRIVRIQRSLKLDSLIFRFFDISVLLSRIVFFFVKRSTCANHWAFAKAVQWDLF